MGSKSSRPRSVRDAPSESPGPDRSSEGQCLALNPPIHHSHTPPLQYSNTPQLPSYPMIPSGGVFSHAPRVKSGKSIEAPRFATDRSLSGPTELHAAAS